MDKVPENLEELLNLLSPARQQMVRRQLAKIAEENPSQYLLFELTLVKLVEMERKSGANIMKAVEFVRSDENPSINTGIEPLKKEIIGEVASLRKDMGRLGKIEEDTRHIRICTDRAESKLDAIRPYRFKIAAAVLLMVLIAGAFAGWHGRNAYAQYQREQYMRSR